MAHVNVMPDMNSSFAYLLRVSKHSRIGVARGSGPGTGSTGQAIAWLLVEGGDGELAIEDMSAEVSGREDVFGSAGWSAVIPPKSRFAIRGNLRYTLVWRPWTEPAEVRVIAPRAVVEERREGGPSARMRAYVPEGPLICGETITEPGRWSSWPPHRHELEEVELFRFEPPHGFGVRVLDTREGDRRGDVVHDGDVRRIRFGFHPVVAAPGTTMYYLWALAGAITTLTPEADERFE